MNKPIQVSFSGGRSSAMMAKIMLDNYNKDDLIFTFANTGKEREETLDFVHECEMRWGIDINWIEYRNNKKGFEVVWYDTASRNGEPFNELIQKKSYLPNPVARFCTADLKVTPMKKFIMSLGYTYWLAAIGLRADEQRRINRLIANEKKDRWEYLFVLDEFDITEFQVNSFWQSQDFDLRISQHEGNCDLCFLKSRNIKRQIMRDNPGIENWWIEKEESISKTFRSDISYRVLREQVYKQPLLVDDWDDGYSCYCGL